MKHRERIVLCLFCLMPFGVIAGLSSSGGINGRVSLVCDYDGGDEILIDGTLFPQTIKVNSQFVDLGRVVKDQSGYRHFIYENQYTELQVELVIGKGVAVLFAGGRKGVCK